MTVSTSLEPLSSKAFDLSKARHLLMRAGFGGTTHQVHELSQMGLHKAVDLFVNYQDAADYNYQNFDIDPDILKPLTKQQRTKLRTARKTHNKEIIDEFRQLRRQAHRHDHKMFSKLQVWWLDKMVTTPRPLQEKLTLLWHSHFATSYRKVRDAYLMQKQNDFFRKNANGSFADLAHGIIHDPAMIIYLDNKRNSKRHANENLVREFMELFTVGVQNYNENDVKGASRSLTGYSEQDNSFMFRRREHDYGIKEVFGQSGRFDGDGFVDVVLANRACPWFIAWKIYRHFVADVNEHRSERPQWANNVIDQIADLLWDNQYQLAPVLKTIFTSRHFYDPAIVGKKIKSPAESVVGTLRALEATTKRGRRYIQDMGRMGQTLFEPPSVAGWDTGEAWINTSTLFDRENMTVYAITGKNARTRHLRLNKATFDINKLVSQLGTREAQQTTHGLIDILLGYHIPAQRRQPFIDFINQRNNNNTGNIANDDLIALLLLITSTPEYQLC